MRITSDSPIEIVSAIVLAHVPLVYAPPDQLPWLNDPMATPEPISVCFTDPTGAQRVDMTTLGASKRIRLTCDNQSYAIVAMLAPSNDKMVMLLTSERTVIFAIHADVQKFKDGTIQLWGAEKGVTLMTAEEVVAFRKLQKTPTLVQGNTLRSFALEAREGDEWKNADLNFSIDLQHVKEVKET